jgi:hypothetical protein
MIKQWLSGLSKKFRLRGHARCEHAHLDRAAKVLVPQETNHSDHAGSPPEKLVTMTVPVILPAWHRPTAELWGEIIRESIELTGIVPFDWEYLSPVPESAIFQSETGLDDAVFLMFFGFDTIDEAHTVKAKFDAIKRLVIIATKVEVREKLQHQFEEIEEESNERPICDVGDGRGPMYWRHHPYFQERPSLH